jgi:uncharacterized membrane protein
MAEPTASDPAAAIPAGDRASRLGWAASTLGHLALLAVLDVAVAEPRILAARLLALTLILVLPGAVVLSAARIDIESAYLRVCAAVGASVGVLMAYAALGSAVLPHLGVSRPIGTVPAVVAVNALVVSLLLIRPRRTVPALDLFRVTPGSAGGLWIASLAAPVLALVGVERLNSGHGSALVQVAIAAVALSVLGGLLAARRNRDLGMQLVLLLASLAALYLYSYRGNHLFGFDVQREFQRFVMTNQAGRWVPPANGDPYSAMLSITALPAMLTRLTGISGLYLFKGILPLLVAAVPGLVYEAARQWVPRRAAYVGAAYVLAIPDFSGQLPGLARQEVAFFFFALLLAVMFACRLPPARHQATVIVVMVLLVVSHYSTSYVAVVVFTVTWLVFGAIRLGRRLLARAGPSSRALITLPVVAAGIGSIGLWDVLLTNSSGNVTSFVSSLADKGLQILPNARHGSILDRYLNGNLGTTLTPRAYYAEAEHTSHLLAPWLDRYPVSLTNLYPAEAAPAALHTPQRLPYLGTAVNGLSTLTEELILLSMVVGVGAVLVARFRRRRAGSGTPAARRVPFEIGVLGAVMIGFLGLVRLSGTVVGSYNADRAQLQGAMILACAIGLVIEWVLARGRVLAAAAFIGLLAIYVNGTGETAAVAGGPAPVLLANGGTGYDYFVASDGEISAAQWLIVKAGAGPLVYADPYAALRIWGSTNYTPQPQFLLTPATIGKDAWVYAPAYSVVDGRAYGTIRQNSATFRFPAAFLSQVENVVYSDPTARVYQ